MRVNRADFLAKLQAVQAGLMPKGIIEQGNCFVFKKGSVYTYNDEVSAQAPSLLSTSFQGAVIAQPLVTLLSQMLEEEIEVDEKKGKMLVRGRAHNRGADFNLMAKILLPLSNVEPPGEWSKLPENFSDALALVQECAGTNRKEFGMTCVHFTPRWIEACDRVVQMARYVMKFPLEDGEDILVPALNVKCVTPLSMTKVSNTPSWLHFKNKEGVRMSCRKFATTSPYKDLSTIFGSERGKPIVFPKGIIEEAKNAEIFTREDEDNPRVHVQLQAGKLRIVGYGISGRYFAKQLLKYKGPAREFQISPKTLIDIVDRHSDCTITERALRVELSKFTYMAILGKVTRNGNHVQKRKAEDARAQTRKAKEEHSR